MRRFEGYHIPEENDRGTTSHVPERSAQQYSHATGSEESWQSRKEIDALRVSQGECEKIVQRAIAHTEQELCEHAIKIADSFIALAREGKNLFGQKVTITAEQHQAILLYLSLQKAIGAIDEIIHNKASNMSYGSQEKAKAKVALNDAKRRRKKEKILTEVGGQKVALRDKVT